MDVWDLNEVVKAVCGAVGTCINLKEDQSVVVLVVHCQKEMKSTTIEKETEIYIYGSLLPVFSFCPHQSLFQELEKNQQLLRPHFLRKMILLADHHLEKNLDECTESIL